MTAVPEGLQHAIDSFAAQRRARAERRQQFLKAAVAPAGDPRPTQRLGKPTAIGDVPLPWWNRD